MKRQILILLTAVAVLLGWRVEGQNYDTNGDYVQTFAGSGFSGYVDGVGQLTMFNSPKGIVADSLNNLFVLDAANSRIRKITPDGTVSTFAGGGNQTSGYGTNTTVIYGGVNGVDFIAIDHSDTLWIPNHSGNLIRIGSDSYVTTFFLNGTSEPWAACVDSMNNVYISDYYGQKVWRYKTNGVLEVFVGSGNTGSADGNGIFTSFNTPTALAADAADNIYVWDSGNHKIRRINQNRDVVTITGGSSTSADGQNPAFNSVSAICVDGFGNLILACGSSIRKMSVTTNAVTLAGSFTQTGYTNGAGNLARFNAASGVCVSSGTIYVADTSNQRIRSITNNPTAQSVLPANLQLNTYPGLEIIGTVGRTYQIQNSPDLNSWSTKATILLNSSPYLWIDQNPVSGNKFYRALLLP
ncbi:MAG TPA: hypothetical protein VIK28_11145 [Sedimentisphaerales bacterium]